MKYFALLTKLGENLLAQATALGTKIELTQMAVGDGGGKLPTPDTNQTKLIAEKRRAAINTLFIDDKNKNQIIAEQIIPEAEGGWWIREIGLFDKAGNLIAVANCPETYKPQLAEGSGRTQAIRMILVVSHTESVTLKIDPSVVLATRKYVDDLITTLDIKLQKQIDNKVNKAGDNVTGTLKFNGVDPLTYDIESLTGNKDELANYLRKFRYLYNSTIFHEIVTKDGIQIATGTEPTNLIYSLSSSGSLTLKGRVIPTDFLDFNQRYLGINNPAISAKKLDKPSRIAGHAFQGQGEDIEITPADIGAQPAGSYISPKELNDGLNGKFDKTGGVVTGPTTFNHTNVRVNGTNDWTSLRLIKQDGSYAMIQTNPASDNAMISITNRDKDEKTLGIVSIPNRTGTAMLVGDFGVGVSLPQSTINFTSTTLGTGFYAMPGSNGNPWGNNGSSHIINVRDGNYGFQIGRTTGNTHLSYRLLQNGVLSQPSILYSTANTTKDRNGNLKVSGSSDALSDYPVGSPIPWPQAAAPTGFLVCNGQAFNKTTYPLLALAYPSGKLPDLRGEFIRGVDYGRGIDANRTVLSAQSDAMQEMEGTFTVEGAKSEREAPAVVTGAFTKSIIKGKVNTAASSQNEDIPLIKFNASNAARTANENRPRNIAFLYIVRAA